MMDDLTCKAVRKSLWDYTSGILSEQERAGVERHLRECHECVLHRGEVRSLRSGLRHLPSLNVPQLLNTKLRVLASRDRARRLVRRDFASWFDEQKSRARLLVNNLLRPFAVPAAGGILASSLCFFMVVETLHFDPDWQNDLPIGISTEVAIDELSPFTLGTQGLMLQLSVDEQGHVTDFELPQSAHASPEEMREIGNFVLYSTFSPAVRLGRRVAGKRLFFIGQHISVKG